MTEELENEKKLGVQRIELIAALQKDLEKTRLDLEAANNQVFVSSLLSHLNESSYLSRFKVQSTVLIYIGDIIVGRKYTSMYCM